jgi:ubiquitin-conjugating enzyme E2 O
LNLDGTVEVTHPDLTVKAYPLERLTRLYDGIEQLEDQVWEDDPPDGHDSEQQEVWAMSEDGTWQPADGHDPNWEDEDETMDVDGWNDDINGGSPNEDDKLLVQDPNLHIPAKSTVTTASTTEEQVMSNLDSVSVSPDAGKTSISSEENPWKRFDILSSAPVDHAFYASTPSTPSKTFLSRLNREYRVLSTSLPGVISTFFLDHRFLTAILESIIVRAYEDRTDLLRSLIIGPDNTPYEGAPFVIDWMMDSNFPHSPPIAHFLSWTNGNGRGKLVPCLSISPPLMRLMNK